MWQEFFRFDLRYQLRQPMLWLVTIVLAAMAFASAGSTSFRIGAGPGGIGNVHLNAPVVIANQLGVLSMISMLLVTVFIAGAVLRDSETGIADLLYATPLRKLDYLLGRFLAGFAVCLLIFGVITLAMMSGSRLSSIDPERLGAFSLWPYAWSFAVAAGRSSCTSSWRVQSGAQLRRGRSGRTGSQRPSGRPSRPAGTASIHVRTSCPAARCGKRDRWRGLRKRTGAWRTVDLIRCIMTKKATAGTNKNASRKTGVAPASGRPQSASPRPQRGPNA
jgi:hypothetical protein